MKKQYVNYYQYLKLQSRALDPQKSPEIGERFGIRAIILQSFLKLIRQNMVETNKCKGML